MLSVNVYSHTSCNSDIHFVLCIPGDAWISLCSTPYHMYDAQNPTHPCASLAGSGNTTDLCIPCNNVWMQGKIIHASHGLLKISSVCTAICSVNSVSSLAHGVQQHHCTVLCAVYAYKYAFEVRVKKREMCTVAQLLMFNFFFSIAPFPRVVFCMAR